MFYFPKTNIKIGPNTKIGHNFKLGLAVLCLLAAVGLIQVGTAQARVIYKGVVNAYKLNIRSAPDRRADVVIVLDKGEPVDVLEARGGIGGWLKVQYENKKGYVRNRPKYITLKPVKTSVPEKKKAVVKKKGTVQKKKQDQAAEPEQARAKKKEIERQIVEESQKVETFSEREVEILDGLNEIDFALNRARVRVQDLRRENQLLAIEIDKIQESIVQLGRSMDETQDYAGRRLNALFRMHMMGSLEMAGPPSSLFDFFIKQNALKKVVGSDLAMLDRQVRDMKELNRLEEDLNRQSRSKTELEEELALQIRIQEKESQKKAAILKEIRQKKKLSQAALASLKESARALEEALAEMGLKGSATLDNTSFIRQKGRLSIPVKGRIISKYGTSRKGDYNSFTFQSGIDIRVERGEPVRSVFKGEVMFAQWLKGYGNLMIINHGDNYYTLYAHVEELFKKKGDRVDTGEVIATAGDTGSIKGLCLHFEVRHHGKPVNPMKWLKKGA